MFLRYLIDPFAGATNSLLEVPHDASHIRAHSHRLCDVALDQINDHFFAGVADPNAESVSTYA
jgi:hypothetical protein